MDKGLKGCDNRVQNWRQKTTIHYDEKHLVAATNDIGAKSKSFVCIMERKSSHKIVNSLDDCIFDCLSFGLSASQYEVECFQK